MPAREREQILSTWAEIAAYLGVSIRTAQNYERMHGLPVRRNPGDKARVFAYPRDLDLWRQHGKGSTDAGSEPTNLPNRAPLEAPPAQIRPKQRWRQWVILFATGAALLALAISAIARRPAEMADIRVHRDELLALNSAGQIVWRHRFPWPLEADLYKDANRYEHSWIGTLPGEREQVLLFSAHSNNAIGDTLTCFDRKGNSRWSFRPGRRVYDRAGTAMAPPFFVAAFGIARSSRPSAVRIVVSSVHYTDQPGQIALLDTMGRVIAEYWHPGHLNYMAIADLDGDGNPEVLLGGVNNGYHQATLVVLDPLRLRGVSTTEPSPDWRFDLTGMPATREKTAIFFPRSCVSRGQPYTRVAALRITPERIIVNIAEGSDLTSSPQLIYDFDHHFHIEEVQGNDDYREKHAAMNRAGELAHMLTAQEFQDLGNKLVVRR